MEKNKGVSEINDHRHAAKLVGVLFILAAVTSIIGLALYQPILGPDFLVQGAAHGDQVIWGAIMELVLVVSAVGTATAMFPILRKYNETVALWHLCFRFLEAIVITIGIVGILSLLTLSRGFVDGAASDPALFQAAGTSLQAVHDWTFLLGPNFFLGINTMMYSYIFYKSGLLPKFIPLLGMTGAVLIFLAACLEMFGVIEQLSAWGAILALPVFANEMTLAVWLLVKGFNAAALRNAKEAAA
ncbi:DUF4386 domain-containing protein [Cohnella sp. JJ-181]|uniref:DUF4386 domain-containing protein n=1 Tax=Cohnella rhizoplanae TaxID=2974897 RepID=UPI0022FF8A03|nr:DUF4386 domain-containing protein [Cohnella sp. JJ-181]CAI6082897.1 hypothetical protein COHCIP112018_03799 [Cohnella sp. JJ-181]